MRISTLNESLLTSRKFFYKFWSWKYEPFASLFLISLHQKATAQKESVPLRISKANFVKIFRKLQIRSDLLKKIINRKLHFLCSALSL